MVQRIVTQCFATLSFLLLLFSMFSSNYSYYYPLRMADDLLEEPHSVRAGLPTRRPVYHVLARQPREGVGVGFGPLCQRTQQPLGEQKSAPICRGRHPCLDSHGRTCCYEPWVLLCLIRDGRCGRSMRVSRFSIFGLISLAIFVNVACQSGQTPDPASSRDASIDRGTSDVADSAVISPKTSSATNQVTSYVTEPAMTSPETSSATDQVTSDVTESAVISPETSSATKAFNPSPTPASLVKFSGFDFQLREGAFWDYKWEYKSSTFCRGCRGGATTDSGTFRVTLGPQKVIEGVTVYEVQLAGKYKLKGSSTDRSFAPRWRYMALEDSRIVVSEDGVTLAVLFDGQEGEWRGSGFFTTRFKAKDLYEGKVSGRDVVVSASSRQGGCRYYRSVGQVCPGGTSTDYTEREVYSPGIGPSEYSFRYSFSSGSGTTQVDPIIRTAVRLK